MVGDPTKGNVGLPPRLQNQRPLGGTQWGRRGKTRAPGRVRAAKEKLSHLSRELQCDEGQQKVLEKCGTGDGVSQRPKCVGISKVGPKQRFEVQNNMGIRVREEGVKQVISQDIKKGNLGLHIGRMVAQNTSPHQGTPVGQSPRCYREQVEWPTEGNALVDQRAKSTGLSVEKTKCTENYSLVSLQGSEDTEGKENEHQEKIPTQTAGQKEINIKKRGLGREEGRISKEVKGRQTEEKGRSLMDSDRESFSSKNLRETLSSPILGVDGEEDVSIAGEKKQSSIQADDSFFYEGNDLGYNTQVGREFKPISRSPSIPGETSTNLGLEVEEDFDTRAGSRVRSGAECLGRHEGTRPGTSGRVRKNISLLQEQKNLGSGRVYRADRGSGSTFGSDLEMGRIQGRLMGLGLD